MILTYFAVGATIYFINAFITYSDVAKASIYYFPAGIVISVVANICWLSIAKSQDNVSELLILALYWDVMLTAIFMIVPLVLFSASVSVIQGIGIVAILTGIVLTKLG